MSCLGPDCNGEQKISSATFNFPFPKMVLNKNSILSLDQETPDHSSCIFKVHFVSVSSIC